MVAEDKSCPCTQSLRDLLRAAKPVNNLLRKIECAGCGKVVWVNSDTKYCFDCQDKVNAEPEKK